ncbi:Actin-related protein 5, partial [Elasticomyces elasticus]
KRNRRGAGEYVDDFGADDRDWEAYRGVQAEPASDDEEPEEDPHIQMEAIEQELLEYDPNFTENDTLKAQSDWKRSLMHAYLYGVQEGEPEQNSREKHQLHLNVERIRVPEVIFQPGIAGVDQAGIIEIIEGIVMNRFTDSSQQRALVKDVFVTGGNTVFRNFDQRMQLELMSTLPAKYSVNIRGASDPILDAWRGATSWWNSASTSERSSATVSRAEYLEKGSDFMKEHDLGNSLSSTFG